MARVAEAAGRRGDLPALDHGLGQVIAALATMRTQADQALVDPVEADQDLATPAQAPDPAAMAALLAKLRLFDLAALEDFRTLAPQLRGLLGPQGFSVARDQVHNLAFAEVAASLERACSA
jgi:hypothetical protein